LAFPKWCSHFLFDPDLAEYLRFPQQETGCNQVAASVCAKGSEYGLPIGEFGESRDTDYIYIHIIYIYIFRFRSDKFPTAVPPVVDLVMSGAGAPAAFELHSLSLNEASVKGQL
jgi:hypothetical protein